MFAGYEPIAHRKGDSSCCLDCCYQWMRICVALCVLLHWPGSFRIICTHDCWQWQSWPFCMLEFSKVCCCLYFVCMLMHRMWIAASQPCYPSLQSGKTGTSLGLLTLLSNLSRPMYILSNAFGTLSNLTVKETCSGCAT